MSWQALPEDCVRRICALPSIFGPVSGTDLALRALLPRLRNLLRIAALRWAERAVARVALRIQQGPRNRAKVWESFALERNGDQLFARCLVIGEQHACGKRIALRRNNTHSTGVLYQHLGCRHAHVHVHVQVA